MNLIRVTVWNEFRHEKTEPAIQKVYPDGIHNVIAGFLKQQPDMQVRTATLDMPEHGLTQEVLDNTDVLIWWGHMAHNEVSDEVVNRVCDRVLDGMGLVALHSAHASKVFAKLMGTRTWELRWREDGEMVRLWNVNLAHPITQGMGDYIELPVEETYGEHFDIPAPDDLLYVSWYPGGEVFRSGCCWTRGRGRVFYFQPGHESCPTYYHPDIQKVITQGVRWAYREQVQPYVTGWTRPLPDISAGNK